MALEFKTANQRCKIPKGRYEITAVDSARKLLVLKGSKGRERRFQTSMLRLNADDNAIALFEQKPLEIFAGDQIRWTDSDHKRGLFNADQARILKIDEHHVTIQTSGGIEHKLKHDDPMLRRIDLAYALNAHMAQGLTSDRGIAVMNSRERNLSNKQTFLVTITRLRDSLTLVVDNRDKLEAAVERNDGSKTSALEVTKRLAKAASAGLSKGRDFPNHQEPKDTPELSKDRIKPYEIGI